MLVVVDVKHCDELETYCIRILQLPFNKAKLVSNLSGPEGRSQSMGPFSSRKIPSPLVGEGAG